MRLVRPATAVLPLLLACGCGYHVAGRADLLPKNIKTIAVPAFGNATSRYYQLSRLLPEDITREFIARTRYRIVPDPAQADAVLNGGVVNGFAYPTTLDPTSGRATAVQIGVTLSLTFTDRTTGMVIWSRPAADFRERYEISLDPAKYFDESSPAMIRLSRDVSRDVVTSILEKF